MINLQKICFICPLFLATPVSILFVCLESKWTGPEKWETPDGDPLDSWKLVVIILLGLMMWLAQVASLTFELFKSQSFLMAREELLFWLPTYNGKCCYMILYFYLITL